MIKLYSPRDSAELALLRSILDAEGIHYYVWNDNFGSLEIGPQIDLFNKKMIVVREDHYEKAKELLEDYLEKTQGRIEKREVKHSVFDKIRMACEVLLFGWMIPGRKRRRKID